MMRPEVLALCLVCSLPYIAASSDDRFIKKYAMMKIYESCFGAEVVKQIRKEMKEAYAKCSSAPSYDESPQPTPTQQNIPSFLLGKLPPGFAMDPSSQSIIKPTDGALHNIDNDLSNNQDQPPQQQQPSKLSSLSNVFAYRPQSGPYPQQPLVNPYMMGNQLRQMQPNPFYQFNPYNMMVPPYNPYAYQQYQQGMQGYYQQQPYFGGNRMSRDIDLRDRFELVSRGPSAGKVKNITCVMQELGYIDQNLEPNYEQITQRISNLPVSSELKGDIQDGLQFCQKFSQCVPDVKRDASPLSQELIKPMFFFRCYKHKKLEACIMKDIRERFTTEDELDTDTDFRSLSRSARSIQDPMHDPRFEALDEMAVYLYDFLSGGNGFDFDFY